MAGQLACLTDNLTNQTTTYVYDVCGRLTTITSSEGKTQFVYNQAGELTSHTLPDGTAVAYTYDKAGRRVSETRGSVLTASYEWNSLGYLARLARVDSEGTSEVFLSHDVFGNLNSLTTGDETTSFVWDTNSSNPALLQAGNMDVFTALGHTAYGTPEHNTGWLSHGWRQTRPTNPANPWGIPPVIASYPSLRGASNATEAISSPSSWGVLLGGNVSVSGLELMGARVYDPSTHSFLTTDPLPPIVGTPYAGNPYEYAGNNPLALLDPLGLRALTDADIQQIASDYEAVNTAHTIWDRVTSWEFVVGVAVVAITVAFVAATIATGGLAAVGAGTLFASGALIGGGGSMAWQKLTTGTVDPGKVVTAAAMGGTIAVTAPAVLAETGIVASNVATVEAMGGSFAGNTLIAPMTATEKAVSATVVATAYDTTVEAFYAFPKAMVEEAIDDALPFVDDPTEGGYWDGVQERAGSNMKTAFSNLWDDSINFSPVSQ